MYFQNEDQKTPPWRSEIRSQFFLTKTPPFLAFGLNQSIHLQYSQRLKKSDSAQIIWVKSEKLLAHSTFEPGPEQTRY